MNSTWLKVILAVVMMLLTIAFGLIPLRVLKSLRRRARLAVSLDLDNRKWPSLMLCLLTCFTGGVFLATCFLHLLPEARDHLETVKENFHWDVEYPLAELISCIGFFLVFFIEELVLLLVKSHGHGSHGDDAESSCSDSPSHDHLQNHHQNQHQNQHQMDQMVVQFRRPKIESVEEQKTEEQIIGTIKNDDGGNNRDLLNNSSKPDDTMLRASIFNGNSANGECDSLRPALKAQSIPNISNVQEDVSGLAASGAAEPECCEGPCVGVREDPPIRMVARPHAHHHGVRSITLLLALSIHSVIEGLAFGIQGTSEKIAALFLTIIFHKCIVAFSVGLQLARTHAHRLKLVVISIFLLALMSPFGCAIGIAVENADIDSQKKDLVIMLFEGLSVGTFLYVTFFEVFIHERDNEHPNMLKLAATLVGFAVIAGIRTMDHDHD